MVKVSALQRQPRKMAGITQEIVQFCAEEVERQQRGPIQVAWMVEAWMFFIEAWAAHWPWFEMLQKAAALVEHQNPTDKWRQVNVRVGLRICPNVAEVSRLMDRWGEKAMMGDMTPEEAYKELMLIHPFADGNGRVGKIVYNALKGTLDKPQMPPNFFNCANP